MQDVARERAVSCAEHATHPIEVPSTPFDIMPPNMQVALWDRYGHVTLYDDTAVKKRFRMPIGVLAVIDSEKSDAYRGPRHNGRHHDGHGRVDVEECTQVAWG